MWWFVKTSYSYVDPKTIKEWLKFIGYFPIAMYKFYHPK
jgi:hypothetical protein